MNLEPLVAAGEPEPLVAWLESLVPSERKGLAKRAKALFAETNRFDRARDEKAAAAAWLAVFACDAPAAARWAALAPDHLPALTERLRPAGLGEFVAKILPRFWETAAALVESGLAPRPPDRLWALGMMAAPAWRRDAVFARWGDVLLRDVHLLFEHEGEGEFSLSAFSGPTWHDRLLAWVAEGRLPRDRAIDLALGALLAGFAAGRQGFFTRLVDALGLTGAERDARKGQLVRLLASPASPTVGWALDHLAGVDLPAADLEPALSARSATTARTALAAIARRREPDVARVAATALGHPNAQVQHDAAEILFERCAPAERDVLVAPWRSGLAPRVAALFGQTPTAPAAPAATRVGPLDPDRALQPFDGDDHALLDAVAAWVEDPTDVDRGEVLIAELATRPRPSGAEAHARALARTWDRKPRVGPGGLLAHVARAWALGEAGEAPEPLAWWSSGALYHARAVGLAGALSRGQRVAWLSLPTHRGGHLAAPVALARWNARQGTVLEADHALALQRLSGPRPPGIEAMAEGAPPVVAAQVGLGPPHPACTRVGAPVRFRKEFGSGHTSELAIVEGAFLTDRTWFERAEPIDPAMRAARALVPGPSSSEPPAGAAAHDRAAMPDRPTEWHARAFHDLVRWFASTEVDTRRPDVVIALHDDATALGPLGHLVVAAALSNAHGGVRIAATDLVLAAIADGRLDAAELGRQLGWLLVGDFVPAGRVVGALTDVVSAGFPDAVRDAWLAALPGLGPVRDLAKVLDQLDAVLLLAPAPIPEPTREALAAIRGGRAEKTARGILRR